MANWGLPELGVASPSYEQQRQLEQSRPLQNQLENLGRIVFEAETAARLSAPADGRRPTWKILRTIAPDVWRLVAEVAETSKLQLSQKSTSWGSETGRLAGEVEKHFEV